MRFHRTGEPEVLQIDELEEATPDAHEVTVSIQAFGLNRAEVMLRKGAYAFDPIFPCRIGGEGTGTVSAFGSALNDVKIGDKVAVVPFAVTDKFGYWQDETGKYGCYAETITVPRHAVVSVPMNLSVVKSAASWMQYLTAWGGLIHYGTIKPNDNVLITAASSSAALGGMQLCKDVGATVIAVTTSPNKSDQLIAAGADHVVIAEQDYGAEIIDITRGQGVNLIYDPVSGALTDTLLTAAAPEARIICYGNLNPNNLNFPALLALTKRVNIRFYSLYDITRRPDLLAMGHKYVYERLEKSIFDPIIDSVFHGLESCPDAHHRMESNQQFGKIVVEL